MPTAAVGTVLLLDPDGLWDGKYIGRWVVNIPAGLTPGGDGFVNEFDFSVEVPGVDPDVSAAGFFIGNDADGDPARFTSGADIDPAAPPGWVTYTGYYESTNGLNVYTADGTWTYFDAGFAITIDPASDPDWYQPAPAAPDITSIFPTEGDPAILLTLYGTDLGSVTTIRFYAPVLGETRAVTPTHIDAETLTAAVPTDYFDGDWHIEFVSPYGIVSSGLTFEVLYRTATLPITEDDAHLFNQYGPDETATPIAASTTHFGNWHSVLRSWDGSRYPYVTSRVTDPTFIHAGSAAVKLEWTAPYGSGAVYLGITAPWNDDPPFGGYSPVPPEGTTVQVSAWIYTPSANNVPTRVHLQVINIADVGGAGALIGAAEVNLTPGGFTQIVATGVTDIDAVTAAANDTSVNWLLYIEPQVGYEGGLDLGDIWYMSDAAAFALLGGWGVGMVRMGANA